MTIDNDDLANTILLVDDDPANIRQLNQAVASLGRVYFASNRENTIKLKLVRSTLHNIIHHLPVFVAYWYHKLNNVFSNDLEENWLGRCLSLKLT